MQHDPGRTLAKQQSTGTILYVTDLTSDSDETLASACDMADRNRAAIELIHVVDVVQEQSNPDAQMGILYRLETLARRLNNLRRNIVPLLLFGTLEDAITKRAWDTKASMVVFGNDSSSSAVMQERLARIRRRVSCPVFIISARTA
ncbi:MAG: universal stress protein [Acidobacteriota bacterium]|jgi:nucleotide-binding universal stress UspA family protein